MTSAAKKMDYATPPAEAVKTDFAEYAIPDQEVLLSCETIIDAALRVQFLPGRGRVKVPYFEEPDEHPDAARAEQDAERKHAAILKADNGVCTHFADKDIQKELERRYHCAGWERVSWRSINGLIHMELL